MSPALAYGRHRGPLRSGSRLAAVAVTLYRRDDQWWIPTTLRPRFLKHHGGQICLPGGRVEAGEDICEAARREFHEELGIECDVTRFCGELSTQFVYASNNRVHPTVMVIEPPTQCWKPDPGEVEEVLEIPLATVLNSRYKTTLIREKSVRRDGEVLDAMSFRAPAFRTEFARTTASQPVHRGDGMSDVRPLASRMIWGATAMILDELAQLLLD